MSTKSDSEMKWPTCTCCVESTEDWPEVYFHDQMQDTECEPWHRLLERIEEAAHHGWTEFTPLKNFTVAERTQIITLPPSIGKLEAVTDLILYHSCLLRIPREIGEMKSLQNFDPYCSYRLHWYPYEITRCRAIGRSTVSTRALYGNHKYRPPFPQLPVPKEQLLTLTDNYLHADPQAPLACSICQSPCLEEPLQAWFSLSVATDVLPLLVTACSPQCLDRLEVRHAHKLARTSMHHPYHPHPHSGGLSFKQPMARQSVRVARPVPVNETRPTDSSKGPTGKSKGAPDWAIIVCLIVIFSLIAVSLVLDSPIWSIVAYGVLIVVIGLVLNRGQKL